MFVLAHAGLPVLAAWLARRRVALDLRLVALGGLLPDLLDKGLLFALGSGTGKALGHTLLLALALLAAGLALRGVRRAAVLGLAAGVASHLLLDAMWVEWDALLWPLFGWGFAIYPFSPGRALWALLGDPVTMAGEAAGAAALGLVAWREGRKGVRRILRQGR